MVCERINIKILVRIIIRSLQTLISHILNNKDHFYKNMIYIYKFNFHAFSWPGLIFSEHKNPEYNFLRKGSKAVSPMS